MIVILFEKTGLSCVEGFAGEWFHLSGEEAETGERRPSRSVAKLRKPATMVA